MRRFLRATLCIQHYAFFFFVEKQDYLDLFKYMIISLDMCNPYYPACTHEDISMSNFVVSRCSNQIDIYLKLL